MTIKNNLNRKKLLIIKDMGMTNTNIRKINLINTMINNNRTNNTLAIPVINMIINMIKIIKNPSRKKKEQMSMILFLGSKNSHNIHQIRGNLDHRIIIISKNNSSQLNL